MARMLAALAGAALPKIRKSKRVADALLPYWLLLMAALNVTTCVDRPSPIIALLAVGCVLCAVAFPVEASSGGGS